LETGTLLGVALEEEGGCRVVALAKNEDFLVRTASLWRLPIEE